MPRRPPRKARRRSLRAGLRWRIEGNALWLKAVVCAAAALCAFNLSVAWLGETTIFPLSPFFLQSRAEALGHYVRHRASCLGRGHEQIDDQLERAGRRHGLPPRLLHALVQVESAGRPHRISPAGAMGLGQLMPGTARLLKVRDPYDPEEAVDASARYLAEQLRRYRGDVALSLAAYNAGPGNVRRSVPRNGETEFYVEKVLKEWRRVRRRPAR